MQQQYIAQIDPVKREHLKDAFAREHNDWFAEAKKADMSLCEYLNRTSPDPQNDYDPVNAVHSLMKSHDLAMKNTKYRDSSYVTEFMDSKEKHLLLGADLQNAYETELYRVPGQVSEKASLGGLTAGDPFRQYQDAPVKVQTESGRRVLLSSIIRSREPINTTDFRIPEIVTPKDASQMVDVAEGALIPIATVQMGKRLVTLRKVGIGLRWTYEFVRNNQIRASVLRQWTIELGEDHNDALVEEAAKVAMMTIPAADSSDGKTKSTMRYPTTGNGNYSADTMSKISYALPQKYVVDTIVGGPNALTKWNLINSGSSNLPLIAFMAQAPEFQGMYQSLNINIAYPRNTIRLTTNIPGAASTFNADHLDSLDVGDSADQLFFFDSSKTVSMLTQRNSETREQKGNEQDQTTTEFFSQYFGFYVYDVNARVKAFLG